MSLVGRTPTDGQVSINVPTAVSPWSAAVQPTRLWVLARRHARGVPHRGGRCCVPSRQSGWRGGEPRSATGQQEEVVYPKRDWGQYLEPSHGDILVPRGKIQAWERSPSGFFVTKGEQVAEFEGGVALKVLESRKLASLFLDERYYLRVEPADPDNTTVEAAKCLEVPCWVFQGYGDADLPENLLPARVRATTTDPRESP